MGKSIRKDESESYPLIANNSQGITCTHHGLIKNWEKFLKEEQVTSRKRLHDKTQGSGSKVTLSDFKFMKVIGTGGFGKVVLAEMTKTNFFVAVKIFSKRNLSKFNRMDMCRREKELLSVLNCPFTVHLQYCCENDVGIYLFMPYLIGGDVFGLLNKRHFLSEQIAHFFAAQIVLAFEYLHNLSILYRDLKPENVLIDHNGYLKVADFGLSKVVETRTYTITGTQEYLAPEIIASRGYAMPVDWWCLGVFIYELCAGFTPFSSTDPVNSMNRISTAYYVCPARFSEDVKDLISKLLVVDVTKRYGTLKNSIKDIKDHRWFTNINWHALVNRELKTPYKPTVVSPDDSSNFDFFDEKIEL